MKDNLKRNLIVLFLFFIAFLLRIVWLEKYPFGLTADEAAQGWTAYSILKTGKDEWGIRFPLNPKSFGDYKPPLLTYLMIPEIAIFGKRSFSVRFPNAIFGSFAVVAVYFLVETLLKNEKNIFRNTNSEKYFPFFSAILLAISPWHLSLSRGAFEANLSSFFLTAGILFFFVGLKKPEVFIFSGIFCGLNLLTYHSAKVVTPFLLLAIVVWKQEELLKIIREKNRISLFAGVLIFSLFSIVVLAGFLNGAGTRAADIGIFSGYKEEVFQRRSSAQILGMPAALTKIFENKIILFQKEFFRNYFSYFSPTFLWTTGAGEATYGMIPGVGVLYFIEIIFLTISVYFILKEKNRLLFFIVFWLMISPVAVSLTRGVGFHANRAAAMMPSIQIISAFGLVKGLEIINKSWTKIGFYAVFLILLVSLGNFLEKYYFWGPVVNSPKMNYGWAETFNYLKSINSSEIVISRRFSEPQSFVMFYNDLRPELVQKESIIWKEKMQSSLFLDQVGEYSLDKYTFRNHSFPEDFRKPGTVIIGDKEDFIIHGEIIERLKREGAIESEKNVNFPDGSLAMKIIKIRDANGKN